MKYPRLMMAAAFAAAALAGCAGGPVVKSAMLTYETKPEGAALFEGGQAIGTAPVTRTYPGDDKSPTIRTPEVTAVWPSGAKESYFTFIPAGSDRVATIERPANAPGLQTDLDHAKKVVAAREAEAKRLKDEALRDARRNSDRCRAQQSGSGQAAKAVTDDCM